MTVKTAETPNNDDFDAAFSQFSAPEPAAGAAADAGAAAATDDKGGAASGGSDDGAGSAAAAAAGSEPGGAADAGAGDGGAAPAADAGAGEAGADKGAAPAAGSEPAGAGSGGDAGGAAGADAGAAGAAAAAAGAAPAAAPTDVDAVLDRLGKLVAAVEKPADKPAEGAAAAEEPKPLYSDDEKQQLASYDKDWPDVAKFEALKRRGEYQEILGYVFQQVQEFVKPLRETVDALAGRTHLQDVRAAVGDYSDDLRQQVIDWTAKQPAYLQPAYNHVIQNGTADEVKDLVDRYRQATGQAAPAAGAATEQQGGAPARTNELSGAAKEAAAALAPVESKRSEVLTPGDPSNYDDAWKQFSKDLT